MAVLGTAAVIVLSVLALLKLYDAMVADMHSYENPKVWNPGYPTMETGIIESTHFEDGTSKQELNLYFSSREPKADTLRVFFEDVKPGTIKMTIAYCERSYLGCSP